MGRRRHLTLLLGLGLTLAATTSVAGCSKPSTRHADGCRNTSHPDGYDLEVYLSVRDDAGGKRALCPGEPLHVHEALTIEVELDRAAYVELIFVDTSGHSGTLERQDTADLTRLAEFRAPSGLLTDHPGEAQLFLVASEEPLIQVDPMMATLLSIIHETGISVDRGGGVHPAHVAENEGSPLHFDTQAELYTDFSRDGVAMLGLSLRTLK